MAEAPEFALAKLAPQTNAVGYPNHDRANDVYNFWMCGYTEDEIASFMEIEVVEVAKDLMYVNTKLSPSQIIKHNNDRHRIILQRNNSEDFRRLMKESLQMTAAQYLNEGMTPAGILKEFREATGMVQKAEPLLQINTQINAPANVGGGINSAEDAIRRVLKEINQAEPPGPQNIVEVQASEVEEDDAEQEGREDGVPDEE